MPGATGDGFPFVAILALNPYLPKQVNAQNGVVMVSFCSRWQHLCCLLSGRCVYCLRRCFAGPAHSMLCAGSNGCIGFHCRWLRVAGNRCNRGKLDTGGWMYANILTDGAAVLTPIGIPVWPVPRSLFAFTTSLFATTSKLLTIGNFIIHELIFLSSHRRLRACAGSKRIFIACSREFTPFCSHVLQKTSSL